MARDPEIDPTTSGITFVDILFALAVGLVLAPFAPWAISHKEHSIPGPVLANLGVALILILTSFIGYHNSENRPRFKVRFVNISLWKFVLDIAMVILYFLFAAYASVDPPKTKRLCLFLLLVAVLYLLWDLAGWYEKWKPGYKAAWSAAQHNDQRPDIVTDWVPTDRWRIVPTLLLAIASAVLLLVVTLTVRPTNTDLYLLDGLMVCVLVAYRIAKDNMDWIKAHIRK